MSAGRARAGASRPSIRPRRHLDALLRILIAAAVLVVTFPSPSHVMSNMDAASAQAASVAIGDIDDGRDWATPAGDDHIHRSGGEHDHHHNLGPTPRAEAPAAPFEMTGLRARARPLVGGGPGDRVRPPIRTLRPM